MNKNLHHRKQSFFTRSNVSNIFSHSDGINDGTMISMWNLERSDS